MPSLYNTKEEALARILEIVGSRIRLNAAQASYLRDCTPEQASEYLCSMSPDIRQYIIRSHNNMEYVVLYQAQYLQALISEINILKDLGHKLESLVKDDSSANVFFVATELFVRIRIEEKQLADQRDRMNKQNQSLARAARSLTRKEDNNAKDSKKAASQAAKEAVRSQPELQSLESRSELRTYKEIYRLLQQSGIITQECDDFRNEYFELKFYGENQHAVVRRNINRAKHLRRISSLLEQIKRPGLNDVKANYMCSLHAELQLKEQKLSSLMLSSSTDYRVVPAAYFLSSEIETLYKEIHKTLQDEVDRHKEEQKKMQEEVRAYEEKLRIEEQEKVKRTEIERQNREALIAAERARLDAEYAKRCAERVENTRKYRAEAVSIIHALGGSIEADTGSSHQRIFFQGCCLQDLSCETSEESTSTSEPTARHGFARKSEITGYNLKLLRNAIISVLPNNYLELLQQHRVNPKNKPRHQLAKVY